MVIKVRQNRSVITTRKNSAYEYFGQKRFIFFAKLVNYELSLVSKTQKNWSEYLIHYKRFAITEIRSHIRRISTKSWKRRLFEIDETITTGTQLPLVKCQLLLPTLSWRYGNSLLDANIV
ncbi:hypothetical protein VCRA2116O29_770013 [Vibrio crassostreae]|nr:hypothetical protein VCRA2116O29_770013 [Vibrio crassostreae]